VLQIETNRQRNECGKIVRIANEEAQCCAVIPFAQPIVESLSDCLRSTRTQQCVSCFEANKPQYDVLHHEQELFVFNTDVNGINANVLVIQLPLFMQDELHQWTTVRQHLDILSFNPNEIREFTQPHMDSAMIWKVQSLVCHVGQSSRSGHYYAWRRYNATIFVKVDDDNDTVQKQYAKFSDIENVFLIILTAV
jgi:hypothetical protein